LTWTWIPNLKFAESETECDSFPTSPLEVLRKKILLFSNRTSSKCNEVAVVGYIMGRILNWNGPNRALFWILHRPNF
jgi:hypothetical protein